MRIGLTAIGGKAWPGGRHYLLNLISSLLLLPRETAEPVIFLDPDAPSDEVDELTAGGRIDAERGARWRGGSSKRLVSALRSVVTGRDRSAEESFRRAGIDVVFQHNDYYGYRFALPCIAWIPDFQHRRMPDMFSIPNRARRELGYGALANTAAAILLSSETARADCERFYPASRGKTAVAHFAVRVTRGALTKSVNDCLARYGLPDRYLYLPNQFWKHKNHIAVVEAMRILSTQRSRVMLVLSGSPLDPRHPEHPRGVLDRIRTYGLEGAVRSLGVVPYDDVITLMRGARALVNPSLSEGWSTTVEEAKLLGVPLVLSDLDVHREQAGEDATYFDPHSWESIAAALRQVFDSESPQAAPRVEVEISRRMEEGQLAFARKFVDIARSVMSD